MVSGVDTLEGGKGREGKGREGEAGPTVEIASVARGGPRLVPLVPLVVGLEEDRLLRPDQGYGHFEVEVGFLACRQNIIGWAIGAVDGEKFGVRALGNPAVSPRLAVLQRTRSLGSSALTGRYISSRCPGPADGSAARDPGICLARSRE